MYNKYFEYLLSDNPKDVLSRTGVNIRKMIHPLFLYLVPFTTKNKLIIEGKTSVPLDRPIIYAATHGFRDDIAFTLKTIGKHAYLLYGSIPDFYQSIDGIALWLNGTIIVDRKDKNSKKASISKMEYAIDLSSDILMYPEGVWNKDPVVTVQKLYTGIYRLAKSKNALVVPVATILNGKNGYSLQGNAYDITELNYDKCFLIIKKINNNIKKIIDIIIYDNPEMEIVKQKSITILERISSINNNDNLEHIEKEINYLTMLNKNMLEHILNTFNEEYWNNKYSVNKEIEKSIIERIIILLKDAIEAEARICTDDLRDKMATLKWELINKHCQMKRDEFRNFEQVSEYWDNYLEELIKTANGLYDHEIEDVAHYIDKTQYSETEVYDILDNIEINKKNALILTKTRNKN